MYRKPNQSNGGILMRNVLFSLLAVLLSLSLLSSCGRISYGNDDLPLSSQTGETTSPESADSQSSDHSGYEAGFKMLRYRWDGYGISQKGKSAFTASLTDTDCTYITTPLRASLPLSSMVIISTRALYQLSPSEFGM